MQEVTLSLSYECDWSSDISLIAFLFILGFAGDYLIVGVRENPESTVVSARALCGRLSLFVVSFWPHVCSRLRCKWEIRIGQPSILNTQAL